MTALSIKNSARLASLLCGLAFALSPQAFAGAPKATGPVDSPLTLWYDRPADNWNQALPVGNGRLGAMIYGGAGREELQLNEDAVWAGEPNNNVNPDMAPYISKVTRALFRGEFTEAQRLANQHLHSKTNHGMPYQTVGSLLMDFPGHDAYSEYRRELDIGNALAKVSYRVGNTRFVREIFSSLADPVVVVRLTADKPAQIDLDLSFASPQEHSVETAEAQLLVRGRAGDREGLDGRIRFATIVRPEIEGGQLEAEGKTLKIRGANSATLFIATATNFNSYRDVTGNSLARAEAQLDSAQGHSYPQLKRAHTGFYRKQFHRVALDLVCRTGSSQTVRCAKAPSSALRKLEITLLFQRFLALI